MKNKKIFLLIIILLVLAIIFFILSFSKKCPNCQLFQKNAQNQQISKICFQENCFEVELAQTLEQQARGLMFRENLDENKGMLFIFEKEDYHSFWMKNTLIPLDIIWLNENKQIVFISANTQPCKIICSAISPYQRAKYVLEINGGLAEKLKIKIGDRLLFE